MSSMKRVDMVNICSWMYLVGRDEVYVGSERFGFCEAKNCEIEPRVVGKIQFFGQTEKEALSLSSCRLGQSEWLGCVHTGSKCPNGMDKVRRGLKLCLYK